MKLLKNRRFLFILGILLISFSLIIEYYFDISGFITGFLNGAGAAALFVAIVWFINPKAFLSK